MIKEIEGQDYNVKLFVKEGNVEKKLRTYLVTDIFKKTSAAEAEDISFTPCVDQTDDSSEHVI